MGLKGQIKWYGEWARLQHHSRAEISAFAIAFVSFSLPLTLFAANGFLFAEASQQPTFSEYFYTPSKPIFLSYAMVLGLALIVYNDAHPNPVALPWSESFATNFAGAGAIITAIFPSNTCAFVGGDYVNAYGHVVYGYIHLAGATMMALGLAYHIFVYFGLARSDKGELAHRIYLICGAVLFGAIIFLALDHLRYFFRLIPLCQDLNRVGYIFYVEMAMVWATGIAWSVKLRHG